MTISKFCHTISQIDVVAMWISASAVGGPDLTEAYGEHVGRAWGAGQKCASMATSRVEPTGNPQSTGDVMLAGWWFGTWLLFFHILGIMIPTDNIFQRDWNHQPVGIYWSYWGWKKGGESTKNLLLILLLQVSGNPQSPWFWWSSNWV